MKLHFQRYRVQQPSASCYTSGVQFKAWRKGKQKYLVKGNVSVPNLEEGGRGGPGCFPSAPTFLLADCFQHTIHASGSKYIHSCSSSILVSAGFASCDWFLKVLTLLTPWHDCPQTSLLLPWCCLVWLWTAHAAGWGGMQELQLPDAPWTIRSYISSFCNPVPSIGLKETFKGRLIQLSLQQSGTSSTQSGCSKPHQASL